MLMVLVLEMLFSDILIQSDSFYFVIGDYGNTNSSNTLTSQLAIIYNAPQSSLVIQSSGYVQMAYGYGTGSDERIKTNIKTIENTLDKTLLLRGVEYNDIRIEPEKKGIGLKLLKKLNELYPK
jgi:hypothetical protein